MDHSRNPTSIMLSQELYDSQVVANLKVDLLLSFITYSMTTLVVYEYLITFRQEVMMIWKRRYTLSTWLFAANRYLMIAIMILNTLSYTPKSCSRTMVLFCILVTAQYIIFAVFSSLRVFTIWDRNVVVSLIVLLLGLVPAATNIYLHTKGTFYLTKNPIVGSLCCDISNASRAVVFNLALGTRLAVIVADVLVLVLTWRKTFRHRLEAARLSICSPLSSLLLRDGTIYFIALLTINIAEVVVTMVRSLNGMNPVSTVLETLTPILISRFLLNLRQLGESEPVSVYNSRFSIPGFRVQTLRSIIGNMGEDLDHGRDAQNHYIDDAIAGQIWTEAGGPFILRENNDFYHSQGVSVEDKESHIYIAM